jgi:2-dehydropantoate 2-reductase
MGAGSIGAGVGGCQQAAGLHVDFVGRPRTLDALRRHGLRLADLDGLDRHLEPDAPALHELLPVAPPPALGLPGAARLRCPSTP